MHRRENQRAVPGARLHPQTAAQTGAQNAQSLAQSGLAQGRVRRGRHDLARVRPRSGQHRRGRQRRHPRRRLVRLQQLAPAGRAPQQPRPGSLLLRQGQRSENARRPGGAASTRRTLQRVDARGGARRQPRAASAQRRRRHLHPVRRRPGARTAPSVASRAQARRRARLGAGEANVESRLPRPHRVERGGARRAAQPRIGGRLRGRRGAQHPQVPAAGRRPVQRGFPEGGRRQAQAAQEQTLALARVSCPQ